MCYNNNIFCVLAKRKNRNIREKKKNWIAFNILTTSQKIIKRTRIVGEENFLMKISLWIKGARSYNKSISETILKRRRKKENKKI